MKFLPKCIAMSETAASFEIDVYSKNDYFFGKVYLVINKFGDGIITSTLDIQQIPDLNTQIVDACKPLYEIIFMKDTKENEV